ncbi:MAG: helix-turn-helix transcriptional regulator [Halothiobacillaceae bacterium]
MRSALTQEQAAGRIGISRRSLGAIERGTSTPRTATAIAMSEAYGVDLREILDACGMLPSA